MALPDAKASLCLRTFTFRWTLVPQLRQALQSNSLLTCNDLMTNSATFLIHRKFCLSLHYPAEVDAISSGFNIALLQTVVSFPLLSQTPGRSGNDIPIWLVGRRALCGNVKWCPTLRWMS